MSRGDNSPGLSRLAGLMQGLAKDQVPTDRVLDLATIQSDKSLLTDTFGVAIPKSDYLVINQEEDLKSGDRVLVGWVSNDAIIIGKIVTASKAI